MGYSTGDACMSFPHSAAIGLMTGRVFGPARLPPGQAVSTLLRPNWDKGPQARELHGGQQGRLGAGQGLHRMQPGMESSAVAPAAHYYTHILFQSTLKHWRTGCRLT